MIQPTFTMLGHNWSDMKGAEGGGYVRALGSILPSQLAHIMSELQGNIQETFNKVYFEHGSYEGLT